MDQTPAPKQILADEMLMSLIGKNADGYPQYEQVNQLPPRLPRGPMSSSRPMLRPSEAEMRALFEARKAQMQKEAYDNMVLESVFARAMGLVD
jgi:hypothetical protein